MPKANVYIYLKEGILDPQGKATFHILENMNFKDLEQVRVGKFIQLSFKPGISREEVARQTDEMCKKLLANPVIEDYHFDIEMDQSS